MVHGGTRATSVHIPGRDGGAWAAWATDPGYEDYQGGDG